MKYAPYSEIINLSEELKEYRKLCRGKSKKFTYYLEWKEYILKQLSKLDTVQKKENLKHFLISNNRVNKNMKSYFTTLMIFCITIFIDKINENYNFLALVVIILMVLFQIMYQSDKNDKEYCFYCDLIEILEEITKEEADICPTPKQTTKTQ